MYFPDRKKAFEGFLRALKPHGVLAMTTWSKMDMHRFFCQVRAMTNQEVMVPKLPLSDVETVQTELKAAGFATVWTK